MCDGYGAVHVIIVLYSPCVLGKIYILGGEVLIFEVLIATGIFSSLGFLNWVDLFFFLALVVLTIGAIIEQVPWLQVIFLRFGS